MNIQVSKNNLLHQSVLLIMLLMFSLCSYSCATNNGSTPSPAPEPNPIPVPNPVPPPSPTPNPTPMPTPTPVPPAPSPESVSTLHLIIVADTKDPKIGRSVAKDSQNMQNFFQEIVNSSNGEIFLNKIVLEGYSVTRNNLIRAIEYPKVKSNDIIVFLYSGHGHRNQWTQTRWPIMNTMEAYTNFADVIKTIKSKNPRQFIALADCCNKTIPPRAEVRSIARGIFPYENIKNMFLTSNVQFAASGCEPEQFSYGNNIEGGFFTSAFISNLAKSLSSASAGYTWNQIFYNVKSDVNQKTHEEQVPQYEKIR